MPNKRNATHQNPRKHDTEGIQDIQTAGTDMTSTGNGVGKVYTVLEVAEILGVSREKVFALLRTKELGSILIGKRGRRIREVHLDAYLRSLEDRPPDGP